MTLRRALLIVVTLSVTAAVLPVSVIVRQQTRSALIQRMRADLEGAPMVLEDRWGSVATVRMMHARDLSVTAGLAEALTEGDSVTATRLLTEGLAGLPEVAALYDSDGRRVVGMADPPPALLDETRAGEMPVSVVDGDDGLHLLALAPVKSEGAWVGATGGTTPVDNGEAQTLAGLTRTAVIITGSEGEVSGSSLDSAATKAIASSLLSLMDADTVSQVSANAGAVYLTTSAAMPGGARVFFLRSLSSDLDVVPALLRSIVIASGLALALSLLIGGALSGAVVRPVRALASAADRLRGGDIEAPLPATGLKEVERLSDAFGDMRSQLVERLGELESANRELEDRQERLTSLQAELVQRERSLATGQLVAQLAHEIRNPIASIRNCLEVIVREVEDDARAAEFAHLAIEELLRMHELAEQMLTMNRPESGDASAFPIEVATEVARLVTAGSDPFALRVQGDPAAVGQISHEGLKQVLLNVVLNAREASEGAGVDVVVSTSDASEIVVTVLDEGPGIPEELLQRIFDPFFTTKADVRGVGLGLFIAEAIVRRYGGSIRAANREDGQGAQFDIVLNRASGDTAPGSPS